MSTSGSNEGIKKCNKIWQKTEPIISVQKLKDVYLFGIEIKNKKTGEELPDSTYQQYINNAVSQIEHDLDISVTPVYDQVEYRDYNFNQYIDWGYFQLNNLPVIEVDSIKLVYTKDVNNEDVEVFQMPDQWLRLQQHDGIIRLIPNAKFPGNLQIGAGGAFFPEVLRTQNGPHFWKIQYSHGFASVPIVVNQAIGLLAAIQALITGGSLVLGAGIASQSLSIDGLSESINTTQSAENSAYSAQIKEYQKLLIGANQQEYMHSIIKRLRDYYQGQVMGFI